MGADLDLPDDVYGFGSWLLWVLATRATAVVDEAFTVGPARPSRHYGMVDGHPVPTPSLVAWLLVAAEAGLPVSGLARRDRRLDERQKVLRTIVSRAVGGEPRLFKESWLQDLARLCGLGQAELDLLYRCRGEEGHAVDPAALRTAITRTLRSRPAPAGRAVVPRSLPRDITSFTGRDAELEVLLQAADGPAAGSIVAVCAVGGMAGVGKTAFAVHAAHRLAARFPHGQVFLPLHGHTPGQQPAAPVDALGSLLLTLGIPVGQIPSGAEARTALWRDRMADKQLLLVLDDAASSDQVRPLLPGAGRSLVLVTSRRHLSALEEATAISLDTLPPDQAAALLVRLAGPAGLSPEDPAVREIVRLCGHLPLAIGMMARQLHHHPAWSAAGQAADLRTTRNRLELMETENLSVAAAFDRSYENLTTERQRLFRRLGLHPGSEIDVYAAAALDGTDQAAARRGLDALYDQYLLTEPAQGRYQMHDLIRLHARSLAESDPAGERRDAVGRLLDYYAYTANRANARIARYGRPEPAVRVPAHVPAPPGPDQARAWLRTERANLIACTDYAIAAQQHERAVALTAGLANLLRTEGPLSEALSLAAAAAGAAAHVEDRLSQASALTELGAVRRATGDLPGAARDLERALDRFRDLGSRSGQAGALYELATVRNLTGYYPGAARDYELALELFRDDGDLTGQACALTELGTVRHMTGDVAGATRDHELALQLHRGLGDLNGQASALIHLGIARRLAGDFPGSVRDLEEAAALYRGLGNPGGLANALTDLGATRRLTGDLPGSTGDLEEALELFRNLGNRLGCAVVLMDLGATWRLTGDLPGATAKLEEALGLVRGLGNLLVQANVLAYLGDLRRLRGDYPGATQDLEEALELYRQIGVRGNEACALNYYAAVPLATGDWTKSLARYGDALRLALEVDMPDEQALALEGIGECHLRAEQPEDGAAYLGQALGIFRRLGMRPDARRVEARLAELGKNKD